MTRLYRTASVLPYCAACRKVLTYYEEPWPPPLLTRRIEYAWFPLETPSPPQLRPYRSRRRRPRWAIGLTYAHWKREERERAERARENRLLKYRTRNANERPPKVTGWHLADTLPVFAQSAVWPPQFHIPELAFLPLTQIHEIGECADA